MKHYQHLCKKERFYIWHALGNTLHLAGLVALPFRLSPSSHSTPERLPRPYSGRPVRLRRIPFQQVTNARLPMPDPIPKLLAPLTNGLIGHCNAAFGEKFFDLTEAEAESMLQPNRMTDNFGKKAMTLITGCLNFHHASLPKAS